MSNIKLLIHTDGGSRGNPGPAAVGVVIEMVEESGVQKKVVEFGKKIGETTNNVAEYKAVYYALLYLQEEGIRRVNITFFLDSELVAYQLGQKFKIKKPHLLKLYQDIKLLENRGEHTVTYVAIPREENKLADALVNAALDKLSH